MIALIRYWLAVAVVKASGWLSYRGWVWLACLIGVALFWWGVWELTTWIAGEWPGAKR